MEINLNMYWNSPNVERQKEVALELVKALMVAGNSQEYSIALVESFHSMALKDGELEEAFINSGEDQ